MAQSSRGTKRIYKAFGLAWTVVTVMVAAALPTARPAGADPLSDARTLAAQLSTQLQVDGTRLDVLGQQYDVAQQRVAQLDGQIAQAQAQIAQTTEQVDVDRNALRADAVTAYMAGSTATGLESVFSAGGDTASADMEYRSVASGNLLSTMDRLHRAQNDLAAQMSSLQATQQQAQAAADAVAASRAQAQSVEQAQQEALSQANGQVKSILAAQQAAAEAAQRQAFLARQAASVSSSVGRWSGVANAPAAGGAAQAIQAAVSQLGVPYQWGGESPGQGFDCSGLTQWAWGQAGVGIPRTAAAQYDAITHVPMSDVQPGDLIFWTEGGSISHVGIYVGNGEVVHAPSTGSVVRYQAVWENGLVGAGRP